MDFLKEEMKTQKLPCLTKILDISFKPFIWETVSVINIDNLISRNNPKERKLKITRGELSAFCQFLNSEVINQRYINYLIETEGIMIKPSDFDEKSTVILAKMILITITYGFHYYKEQESHLSEFSRIIYHLIMKLYQGQFLLNEDVGFFLEYAWILSCYKDNSNQIHKDNNNVYFNDNTYMNSNNPIRYLNVIRSALDSLSFLAKDSSIKETDNLILSFIDYINEKIKLNFNIRHILKENDTMLSLIDLVQYKHIQELTIKKIYSFVSNIYSYSYNEHFLNYFLSPIKNTLYDTYSRKETDRHMTLIRSQLSLVLEMFKTELSIKMKDAFQSDNGFVFNDNSSNGILIQMLQGKGLNKSISIVFSFKPADLQNRKEYSLITFTSIDFKTLYFKLSIRNDLIILTSKTLIHKPFKFNNDQTYMIILDWKKDSILSSKVLINLTINGEKQVSNSRKEELDLKIEDKFVINIGFDPFNIENNFVGQINPILIFKKNIEDNMEKIMPVLQWGFKNQLNNCAGYDMTKYEKYSPRVAIENKSLNDTIKFIKEYCVMVISPYSVMNQRHKNQIIFPEIYYDFRKEIKEDICYEFKSFPITSNCGTYPVIYKDTSMEFIENKGLELVNLHLEYYYNLILKTNNTEYVEGM